MKKLILVYIFIISGIVLSAQDFHGGLLGGLATTEVNGDTYGGPNKAGIYFGGFVNRHFTERSSIQMELDFIQKGSRDNPDTNDITQSYLLRLNYIEMPVHYKYDFHERGTLEAGFAFGVLVYSQEESPIGYEWVSGEPFDQFDFSFNIGAYYTLLKKVRINVRYSNSIVPNRSHAGGATYRTNRGWYNEVLSFVLYFEL